MKLKTHVIAGQADLKWEEETWIDPETGTVYTYHSNGLISILKP